MNWKQLSVKIIKALESTFHLNIFENILKKGFLAYNLGEIKRIKIDSVQKKIECTALLIGEQQDIEIAVDKYSLIESDEGLKIVINKISISRKWIDTLAQKYLIGKSLLLSDDIQDFAEILK